MDSTTLYRKYRPSNFSEVLGQEQVTKVLMGQIENEKFSHAYIFAGTKGTGKTSVARIFAKEIGTEEQDVYEIDAASNRGIDEIRDLRQSIQVLPFSSSHKVYIIDEAHMLTPQAFDAFLKSLEEPPAHVIFILATTELQKIPTTVQSRCEIYNFKRPTQKILKDLIRSVAKAEGREVLNDAADLIALLGNGAFRDTLGSLQKILNATKDTEVISLERVSEITGVPGREAVNGFVGELLEGDLSRSLMALGKVKEANQDVKIFLELVLSKLRVILLLRLAPEMKEMLKEEYTEEDFTYLLKMAKENKSKIGTAIIPELLQASEKMKNASIPSLPIELALVRIFGYGSEQ